MNSDHQSLSFSPSFAREIFLSSLSNILIVSLIILGNAVFTPLLQASDTEYHYTYFNGDTGANFPHPSTIDNDAGNFESVVFDYNSSSELLNVEIVMSPPSAHPERFAKSFTLSFSDRNQPHQNGSEIAIFYFDGTRQNPVLTAYTYQPSAQWDSGSWFTGDQLCTSLDIQSCNGWINSLSMRNNADGTRTFAFSVYVDVINAHIPSIRNTQAAWKGAQFGEKIGYWLTPYGYPNISFFYNGNGFINLLTAGTNPGIEYHGFFDADNKNTFRMPMCLEPQNFSQTIFAGQNFTTQFTGISPDGNPLTVYYSGIPSTANVTPANGSVISSGTINSVISWTPSTANIGDVVNIDATYSDQNGSAICSTQLIVGDPSLSSPDCLGVPGGNAQLDICNVCQGNNMSCLDCETVNILDSQYDMDNSAIALLQNVRRSTRKAFRASMGTADEERLKRFRRVTNRESRALYEATWAATWSFDQFIMTCTNLDLCVQISNVSVLTTFNDNIELLFANARSAQREIDQLGARSRKLRRQVSTARTQAQAAADQVPALQSDCGF